MKINKISVDHFKALSTEGEFLGEKINELVDAFNENYVELIRLRRDVYIPDNLVQRSKYCMEGKCFSYCDKYLGVECDCLLGKIRKEEKEHYILKNCPFCSGKADIHRNENGWFCCCAEENSDEFNCLVHIKTCFFSTKQEAVSAWNKRA